MSVWLTLDGDTRQVWAFATNERCEFAYGPATPGDFVVVRTNPVRGTGGRYDIYGVRKQFFEANYDPVPGTVEGNVYRKKGHIFAQRMSESFEVAVSAG